MYCGNCGAQNPDGAAHCGNCGAPLNPAPAAGGNQSAKKNRAIGIAVIAGAVAVVAAVVLLVVLLGGGGSSSAKSAAVDFVETMFDGKISKLVDMVPDELLKGLAKERDISKSEARDMLAGGLEELESYTGILKLAKLKVGHAEVEDMDRDDLDRLKDDYAEYDVKVKDGKTVEVEVSMEFMDEKETETIDVPVVKIGGSWYVDFMNLDDMF